jgi:hypothetical protein
MSMFTVHGEVRGEYVREQMTIGDSTIPAQKFVQVEGKDAQGRATIQDVAVGHNEDFRDYKGQDIEIPVHVWPTHNNGKTKLKIQKAQT